MPKKTPRQLNLEIADHQARARLGRNIQRLLNKWQPRFGVSFRDWGIRKMKSYWGSTNKEAKEVWFNLGLVKLPPSYVEYVVVHELAHLLTDGHDDHFYELMDRHLPGWKRMQARIEEPLRRYS